MKHQPSKSGCDGNSGRRSLPGKQTKWPRKHAQNQVRISASADDGSSRFGKSPETTLGKGNPEPSTTLFFDPRAKPGTPLDRLKTHHPGAKEILTNLSCWDALVRSYIEREMPFKQRLGSATDDTQRYVTRLDCSLWEYPQVENALYFPLESQYRTFRLLTLLPGTKNDGIQCFPWYVDHKSCTHLLCTLLYVGWLKQQTSYYNQ